MKNLRTFGKKFAAVTKKKKKIDIEPVYNEKYLEAQLKSYNGKITTKFCNNLIPKEGSQLICLSITLTDSIFRSCKNYYPQVFLKEYNYVVKEKKMPECIIDDIDISYDNSDREESSDKETFW